METIYDFGLTKEQLKKIRDWAKEEYEGMDELNHQAHMIRADINSQQHWINDFFKLNKNPW